MIALSAYAALVGLIAGLVAQGLLELIYLFTNLFFYGHWSFAISYPVHHHLGAWVILAHVCGICGTDFDKPNGMSGSLAVFGFS